MPALTDHSGAAGSEATTRVVERLSAEEADAEIEAGARELPWWRRPRELRRQLAWTLVGTALASVLLVGALNFFAARALLDSGTKSQLVGIGEARARTIEIGVERALAQVSAVSRDLGIVTSLEAFDDGFDQLADTTLTTEEAAALEAYYQDNLIDPINELGLAQVTLPDYLPASAAARYLQYHYVVSPASQGQEGSTVVDPDDGSAYSATHATFHPSLETAARAFGDGDWVLVTDDGDVVYSVDKNVDLGTNLVSGPYADTEIGRVVTEVLPQVRAGNPVLADLQIYLPADGRPVLFAAAAVQRETEVIGALVVQIPIKALSSITTADQQWEAVGLSTGESYVVGPDLLLRSESRIWIEDPEGYLERVDDEETARLIEIFESPVGLQPVDTEPVRVALRGEEFEGTAQNYLGTKTFSYATPISVQGVEWVVVVDIPLDDARAPLFDYVTQLGIVLLIILPLAGLLGVWLARRLTQPIPPVLEAANAIVAGERNLDIPDLGNDEFGDLARRLGDMASDLGEREAELHEEYETRRQLLLSVLPPRALDASGSALNTAELADLVTVIAATVVLRDDQLENDYERHTEVLNRIADVAESLMNARGIERVRASADAYLFLAGAGSESDGTTAAIAFAEELVQQVADAAEQEQLQLGLKIGMSTGPVATGVLDSGSLTMGAWGQPVREALAVTALSPSDGILVDASTAELVGFERLSPSTNVVALDGEPMDLYSLDPIELDDETPQS